MMHTGLHENYNTAINAGRIGPKNLSGEMSAPWKDAFHPWMARKRFAAMEISTACWRPWGSIPRRTETDAAGLWYCTTTE